MKFNKIVQNFIFNNVQNKSFLLKNNEDLSGRLAFVNNIVFKQTADLFTIVPLFEINAIVCTYVIDPITALW